MPAAPFPRALTKVRRDAIGHIGSLKERVELAEGRLRKLRQAVVRDDNLDLAERLLNNLDDDLKIIGLGIDNICLTFQAMPAIVKDSANGIPLE